MTSVTIWQFYVSIYLLTQVDNDVICTLALCSSLPVSRKQFLRLYCSAASVIFSKRLTRNPRSTFSCLRAAFSLLKRSSRDWRPFLNIVMPLLRRRGGISFLAYLSVCHCVCHCVCLSQNFNLMDLHILSCKRSRSRSSFKVKGQIYGSKSLKRGHNVS